MKIDLFTLIAQIINFGILVFLLYVFLYKKIIKAIDHKNQKMKEQWEKAQHQEQKAKEEREALSKERELFEENRETLFQQAKQEAKDHEKTLLDEARRRIEDQENQWQTKLEQEKKDFLFELEKQIGNEVYKAAGSVLHDLASADLNHQIFQRFLEALDQMPPDKIKNMRSLFAKGNAIDVISAWQLSDQQKTEIIHMLEKVLEKSVSPTFQSNVDHNLGLSLYIDHFRLSWTSEDHLSWLKNQFEQFVEMKHG